MPTPKPGKERKEGGTNLGLAYQATELKWASAALPYVRNKRSLNGGREGGRKKVPISHLSRDRRGRDSPMTS